MDETITTTQKDDGDEEILTGVLFQQTTEEDDSTRSKNNVWLIMGHTYPRKDANSSNKNNRMKQCEWWNPGQTSIAMASSAEQRDEYIRQHATTILKDGYTVQTSYTIEQLRDQLCSILPPASSSLSTKKDDNDSYNDRISGISEEERIRFELFRNVIKHEDDLLNQRVSWIILAQSFLMAAFITSSSHNMLRYVTAAVGMLTLLVTMPAIVAAGQNIELQQQIYFQRIPTDERCLQLHGHPRDAKNRGHNKNESILRKRHGHLLPTMAFRGTWGVPILKTVIAIATIQLLGWICLIIALFLH